MSFTLRVVWLALVLSAFAWRAPAEDFTNAIHSFLQHRVEVEKKDAGIVVGLVDENGTRVVCYGKLDDDKSPDVNGDTLFEVGSITKTFTCLLLQDMIERGEMKLDDPVAKYLPATVTVPKYKAREITLRHLATHMSGLPFIPDNLAPKRVDNPYADYTVEKLNAFLAEFKLTHAPGTKWEYSDVGMGLLGQAIATKAGTNYESLLVDRICRPLNLDSTRITLTPELKARFATGHNQLGCVAASLDCQTLVSASALHTTASDLLKYLSVSLGLTPSPLKALIEKIQAPQIHIGLRYYYGLGWASGEDLQGKTIIYHAGSTPGYSSFIGFERTQRRGVIVLSCSDDLTDVYSLGHLLLESEWDSAKRPKEIKISSAIQDAYVGQYRLSPSLALGWVALRYVVGCVPIRWIVITSAVGVGVVLLAWLRRRRRPRWRRLILRGAVVLAVLAAILAVPAVSFTVCAVLHPGLDIRREGDRLFARSTVSPIKDGLEWAIPDDISPRFVSELLPASETRLIERLTTLPFTFSPNGQGKVTHLTAQFLGATFAYRKVSDAAPEAPKPRVAIKLDPKLLDSYIGRYEFAPDLLFPKGVILSIQRQGDQLIGQAVVKSAGSISSSNSNPDASASAFDIFPESETNFLVSIFGTSLTFTRNAQGEVLSAVRRVDGWADCEAKRLPANITT